MLIRIVRMSFKPEKIEEFRAIFNEVQPMIADFDGCLEVKLFGDPSMDNVFYTHSIWESETKLNAYRNSTFFESTWKKTKTLFNEKPQAYSLVDPDHKQ